MVKKGRHPLTRLEKRKGASGTKKERMVFHPLFCHSTSSGCSAAYPLRRSLASRSGIPNYCVAVQLLLQVFRFEPAAVIALPCVVDAFTYPNVYGVVELTITVLPIRPSAVAIALSQNPAAVGLHFVMFILFNLAAIS